MSKKKKIFVLVAMALLLVVTGYLNIALNKNNNQENLTASTTVTASFLSSYRSSKLATRNSMLEYYDSIIASATTQAQIADANNLKMELAKRMESETILESMVMASGYEDAVVTIADENTTVMVKSDNLTGDDVSKILTILVGETKADPTNVKIMSV
ncbi:MAG: SpoIIIAH-like family protein [Clostridia bacterium]|nr:SpoIIIAH-like family protein [Clostridia bacterium]